LQVQHEACRSYVRRRLRKRVEGTFVDDPVSRLRGFGLLLGHLAVCRNRRVVVHRLDRLPGSGLAARVAGLGARVLSVSERNVRTARGQAGLARDVAALNRREGIGGRGRGV
jgi:hypothetical protein